MLISIRSMLQYAAASRSAASLAELDAATGALVRVLTGPGYRFNILNAIVADGTHVWVADRNGDSVTEFPASSQ